MRLLFKNKHINAILQWNFLVTLVMILNNFVENYLEVSLCWHHQFARIYKVIEFYALSKFKTLPSFFKTLMWRLQQTNKKDSGSWFIFVVENEIYSSLRRAILYLKNSCLRMTKEMSKHVANKSDLNAFLLCLKW